MLRIYINDTSGNEINDPSRSTEHATGLQVESLFPKGWASASFTVRRDIAERWAVKSAHELIVRDGNKIVYQGILKNLQASLVGAGETIKVEARGYYSLLANRVISKRWVDGAPLQRFAWPSSQFDDEPQQALNSTIRGNLCRIKLPGDARISSGGDDFLWRYYGVATDDILKVVCDWRLESGASDNFQLNFLANGVTNVKQESVTDTTDSGTAEATSNFSSGIQTFDVQWLIASTDGDADGFGHITNVLVYFRVAHVTAGTETYYADEIIKDILSLIGNSNFSVDFDQMGTPNFALIPFTTKGFESADVVIQRAVGYGDASNNTWAFNVWDEEYGGVASDGKPKCELIQRPVLTDWEYEVMLGDLRSFTDSLSLDQVHNWIAVTYEAPDGEETFISPDTDATLTDATSVAAYYRRDKHLSIGQSTAAKALEHGERFLALHKDPLRKTSLSIVGRIRNKQGVEVPCSWVRAGQRIRIADAQNAPVIVLGRVQFNADTEVLTCQADLPPDSLAVFAAQQSLEINRIR